MNFDKIVAYELRIDHCAKRKTTSIICVASLHSLPWNTTSKAHKIRTTLKRRSNFKRASGNRCLHDAGKIPASSKSSSGSRGGSSNPMSIDPRTKSNYRRGKNPSRTQNLDYDSWMTDVQKHSFEILIFKYVYFDTMIDVTVKKREQRIGMLYFQYYERESVHNPKIKWKNNSRVRIGRIAFTAEAANL